MYKEDNKSWLIEQIKNNKLISEITTLAKCKDSSTITNRLKKFNLYELYYENKNNKFCCICGDLANTRYKEDGKIYCNKHYKQIYRHGKTMDRTYKDKNEIVKYDDYAEMLLYNRDSIEIARTFIDLEDIDKVREYKWHLHSDGHMVANYNNSTIRLHRLIMDVIDDENIVVDHINRNPLNNTKNNLRCCNTQENSFNGSLRINNTSGITGVYTDEKYWYSDLVKNDIHVIRNKFYSKDEAIKDRLISEIIYFGEFAPQKQLILGGNYKMTIKEIIEKRDSFKRGSEEWNNLNNLKNEVMTKTKPSTNENILYFKKEQIDFVKEGFSKPNEQELKRIYSLPQQFDKRCNLEYNDGITKHPIPYVIIKYKDEYFFILREKGSGETLLMGLKGLIGGHISDEDEAENIEKTIENGFIREVNEETGLTIKDIKNKKLIGIIKSEVNKVDENHLGLVYEIEIDKRIDAIEEGVITGIWINKSDLEKHYESFESWSRITYDNLLK